MIFLIKFFLWCALAFVVLIALLSASASGFLGTLIWMGLAAGLAQLVIKKVSAKKEEDTK